MERLQKAIAHAGLASRRAAERLIAEGRVSVNGTVVTRPGQAVDPDRDAIRIDGKPVPRPPRAHCYLMLNKPRGYVTTLSDPEGRATIRDLLPDRRRRLYPVGRLDYHSEGLLLLTDDGEWAHRLMHPSSRVEKTYAVKVRGRPEARVLERLAAGVVLDGRRVKPVRVRRLRPGENAWLEITVTEGRKRLVRRLLDRVGHPVLKLRRTGYGDLRLGNLSVGAARPLTPEEVDLARAAFEGAPARRERRRSRSN